MILALYIIVFFHAALAGTRPLSEGEAFAFEALFGTSDMTKLLAIERNPAAYWEEREKSLKEETLSHRTFCQTYTHEVTLSLKSSSLDPEIADGLWFYDNIDAIGDTIKLKIPEDHPAHKTALTLFTACACDYLRKPERFDWMANKPSFDRCLNEFMQTFTKGRNGLLGDMSAFINGEGDFNSRLRWIRNNAGASIFDCLILLSNQEYLCHALPLKTRTGFAVHDTQNDTRLDDGDGCCLGEFSYPIIWDVLSRARNQYLLDRHLCRQYGLSRQKHFKQCFNKSSLIAGDIMSLAQQALGCFYHFCALPASPDSWDPNDVHSCIFPTTDQLAERSLAKIVPYFVHCGLNWHTQTLEPSPTYLDTTHALLLELANTSCKKAGLALLATPMHPAAAA